MKRGHLHILVIVAILAAAAAIVWGLGRDRNHCFDHDVATHAGACGDS